MFPMQWESMQRMRIPKTNVYGLRGFKCPPPVYRRAKSLIEDFPRLLEVYQDLQAKLESPKLDGLPRGSGISDPTGTAALRMADISSDIKAVTRALKMIPAEYRKEVYEHIIAGTVFPPYACRNTWAKWVQRLVYFTALYRGYY